MNTRSRPSGVVLTLLLLVLTGCGGSPSDSDQPDAAGGSSSAPASSPSPTAMSTPTTPSPDAATTETTESPESASTKSEPAEKKAVITIRDFTYTGARSVEPGARITIKNEDDVPHTVTTLGDETFDVTVEAGATKRFKAPSEPGRYRYYCEFHPNMRSALRVG